MRRRLPGPLAAYLRTLPRHTLLVFAYVYVILLGVVDYLTPRDLSFLVLYVLPLSVVTFYVGSWAGAILSLACTAVWFMANIEQLFVGDSSIIPYWNFAEKLGFFLLMTWLFAALRQAMEHEKESAGTDPATGLPGLRRFREALASEIARSRRFGHPLSLARLDVDGFRELAAARRGAGDAILGAAAEVLRRSIRDVDTAARIGEDEFAILMPETGYDAARANVRAIQQELSGRPDAGAISLSIGLATYLGPAHSADEALAAAGRLMHAGRSAGGTRFVHKIFGEERQAG